MDHFVFECVSKREPTNKEEISKGWYYITLLDRFEQNIAKDNNHLVYRCAVSIQFSMLFIII